MKRKYKKIRVLGRIGKFVSVNPFFLSPVPMCLLQIKFLVVVFIQLKHVREREKSNTRHYTFAQFFFSYFSHCKHIKKEKGQWIYQCWMKSLKKVIVCYGMRERGFVFQQKPDTVSHSHVAALFNLTEDFFFCFHFYQFITFSCQHYSKLTKRKDFFVSKCVQKSLIFTVPSSCGGWFDGL